jgi:hypothetical protein
MGSGGFSAWSAEVRRSVATPEKARGKFRRVERKVIGWELLKRRVFEGEEC